MAQSCLRPGVGDDTRSLAVLLAWLRAMDAAAVRTRADMLFVADVGEEGPGDLRGMRHLFQKGPYKERISAFITVDSPDMEHIAIGGVGSKRYRVTFKGPGGHSYGAFGLVNPMFAMADAIARLGRIKVPTSPKTTYSARVTGGGTSINSIPNSVWTDFDLRSELAAELARLEATFLDLTAKSVAAENAARSTRNGAITADIEKIGDRPAGRTDEATNWCGSRRPRSARMASSQVRDLLDRREHPDEPRHPRHQDRLRRHRRPSALAGGMDRRGARAFDPWHGSRSRDAAGGRRSGLTDRSAHRFQNLAQRVGRAVQRHVPRSRSACCADTPPCAPPARLAQAAPRWSLPARRPDSRSRHQLR